jgi:hypothetical protein
MWGFCEKIAPKLEKSKPNKILYEINSDKYQNASLLRKWGM